MKIEDHVAQFRKAAIDKGDYAEPAEDHALHAEMSAAFLALQLTETGREAFAALIADPSLHVRTWVAAQLLHLGNEGARVVLEDIASGGGLSAFSAEVTLAEHDAGRLGSPL